MSFLTGLDFKINGISYKSYLQSLHVSWPCTTDLPTASAILNNQSGIFMTLGLLNAPCVVTQDGNVIHKGNIQTVTPSGQAMAGGQGNQVALISTMGYELSYLYEGMLQAVGTNMTNAIWGNYNTSTLLYVPYQPTWVSSVSALLMDVGTLFQALLHNPQPNQDSNYHGRLGYDCTTVQEPILASIYSNANAGQTVVNCVPTTSFYAGNLVLIGGGGPRAEVQTIASVVPGVAITLQGNLAYTHTVAELDTVQLLLGAGCKNIDYTGGALSLYIKGMWTVGSGQLGKQKTGIQILSDLSTQNIIGITGGVVSPQYVDWYIDPVPTIPNVVAFKRGSLPSSSEQSFTLGQDGLQSYTLPVDITSVANTLVGFFNGETVYPNSADDWSNYPNGTQLNTPNTPWFITTTSGSGTSSADASNTAYFKVQTSLTVAANPGDIVLNVNTSAGFNSGDYIGIDVGMNSSTGTITGEWNFVTAVGPGTIHLTSSLTSTHAIGGVVGNFLGTSNLFASSSTTTDWHVTAQFPIQAFGQFFDPQFTGLAPTDSQNNTRNISSINFSVYRLLSGLASPSDSLQIQVGDASGTAYATKSITFGADAVALYNIWYQWSLAIPASGYSGWTPHGGWDFGINSITYVQFNMILGNPGGSPLIPAQKFWIDFINFSDSYYYSPVWNLGDGTTAGEITYDTNSINAYGYRVLPFTNFYQTGLSESKVQSSQNLLTSRRGKQSNGTVTFYGINSKILAVKPGYKIQLNIPNGIYQGTTTDSTITDWIVEQIDYNYDTKVTGGTGGTTVSFTLNPYYASFNGTSPDQNARNSLAQALKSAKKVSTLAYTNLGKYSIGSTPSMGRG